MGAVAIILGRAGSRGVAGKNLAIVGGRECARWTIDAARDARCVSRIVLSTDSSELQRIGLESGIDVVLRPAELANATARVDDAARHALAQIGDDTIDHIVILYANVPVRPPGLIDEAIGVIRATNADSVQSYARVGKRHPWWTARVDEQDARVTPWEGDVLNHGVHRRQELPPAFVPDGGVLVVARNALVAGAGSASPHAFLGSDQRAVMTAEGDVIDIDSRIDLIVADAVLTERHEGAGL